jgi:hypothetical protein
MSIDQSPSASPAPETEVPRCPKCTGEMWDNRESKRNPRAPDFKCKDRSCDGVIWPPRESGAPAAAPKAPAGTPDDPACPVCGGKMWDDRLSKRNPRAPDFKCRNKPKYQGAPGCPGVIWPPRDGERRPTPAAGSHAAPAARAAAGRGGAAPTPLAPPPEDRDFPADFDDELPF